MPWNFPLWQVVRFAAPALMAGNVGLLKHASNVPQTALYLEDVLRRGGFPEGCFQTLLIGSGAVEGVLRDPRVAAVTLTGSEPAGRSVAQIAGSEIKKAVLELGGSDPYVVMPSADLDRAAEVAVTARVQNNGQSCIAAKRFIIHHAIYDAFAERFVTRMRRLVVGDPMVPATDVGPLATKQGREDVAELVDDAVSKGAQVLCGGNSVDGPGWFYPPTVIAGLTPQMRIYAEEVFGPVAALLRVPDIDSAIEVANATTFGLGSNAWTTDPARAGAVHPRARSWRGVHQRHDHVVPRAPFRRNQALRLRAGAVRARDQGVLQHQDRLDQRLSDPLRGSIRDHDQMAMRPSPSLLQAGAGSTVPPGSRARGTGWEGADH